MLPARLRQVLEPCRHAPETCGPLRRPDRQLAIQLYNRGVPLDKIQNALVLAAVRRLIRPANAPPLAIVRAIARAGSRTGGQDPVAGAQPPRGPPPRPDRVPDTSELEIVGA